VAIKGVLYENSNAFSDVSSMPFAVTAFEISAIAPLSRTSKPLGTDIGAVADAVSSLPYAPPCGVLAGLYGRRIFPASCKAAVQP